MTRYALAVPESITLASRVFCILFSAFSITLRFFTPVGWGYAGPALGLGLPRYQLRISDIAVTDSARFCGGGFDSFLGFEYVVLITLAYPCSSTSYILSYEPALFAHFGFVEGHLL